MSNLMFSLDPTKFDSLLKGDIDVIMKEDKKSSEDGNSNPSSNSGEDKIKQVDFDFAESIANQMGNFQLQKKEDQLQEENKNDVKKANVSQLEETKQATSENLQDIKNIPEICATVDDSSPTAG